MLFLVAILAILAYSTLGLSSQAYCFQIASIKTSNLFAMFIHHFLFESQFSLVHPTTTIFHDTRYRFPRYFNITTTHRILHPRHDTYTILLSLVTLYTHFTTNMMIRKSSRPITTLSRILHSHVHRFSRYTTCLSGYFNITMTRKRYSRPTHFTRT